MRLNYGVVVMLNERVNNYITRVGIYEIIGLIGLPCLRFFYFTVYVSGFVISSYFC